MQINLEPRIVKGQRGVISLAWIRIPRMPIASDFPYVQQAFLPSPKYDTLVFLCPNRFIYYRTFSGIPTSSRFWMVDLCIANAWGNTTEIMNIPLLRTKLRWMFLAFLISGSGAYDCTSSGDKDPLISSNDPWQEFVFHISFNKSSNGDIDLQTPWCL